jgi:hypothetical protein
MAYRNKLWSTCYMISYFAREQEKEFRVNSSIRISTNLVLEITLDQYLHNDTYTWQYINDSTFLLLDKLPMHLKTHITWLSKFWYTNLVGSIMVSQQVFWYTNGTRTNIRWTNHLCSTSIIVESHMMYIIIDNLMNEIFSFKTILT